MEKDLHLETIYEIKRFINQKDFEGLKTYIERREQEVKQYYEDNRSSDYIEKLVDNLQ